MDNVQNNAVTNYNAPSSQPSGLQFILSFSSLSTAAKQFGYKFLVEILFILNLPIVTG
jgi:hypothetical protein